MNIILLADNGYFKYSIVLIKSILHNHPTRNISVYYLSDNLDKDKINKLKRISKSWKFEIHFILLDLSKFEIFNKKSPFTIRLFSELFVHEYLPKSVEKALFLDIDTIVDGPIDYFYDVDLGTNILCGVTWGGTTYHKLPHVPDPSEVVVDPKYVREGRINAGVVLFNLKQMREENIDANYYLEFLDSTQELMLYNAFKNRILYANSIYNYRALSTDYYLEKNMNVTDARIIPYARSGNNRRLFYDKPWAIYLKERKRGYVIPYFKNYERYNELASKYVKIWWKYAAMCDDLISELEYEANIRTKQHLFLYPLFERYSSALKIQENRADKSDYEQMIRGYVGGNVSRI